MVEGFEKDATKKNPYQMEVSGLNEGDMRLQFAIEEAEEAKSGAAALHKVTPSSFIVAGLELKDQQRPTRRRVSHLFRRVALLIHTPKKLRTGPSD
ncbi:hypothetical protein B0H14DRAFT_3487810 [Mycena olivaceomarginata]|nr:hypothetical protein B0H14DRAFT_3487810 [Mycena olivaceomarginata]